MLSRFQNRCLGQRLSHRGKRESGSSETARACEARRGGSGTRGGRAWPYTERGHTANFNVYYDNSLGANGQGLADAVLGRCEQDFAELQGWFGVTPGGLPFNVYIDPGTFGAYHAHCAATELHLAAF